jgi:4-hydroxybenzoate polyprenyltransferase
MAYNVEWICLIKKQILGNGGCIAVQPVLSIKVMEAITMRKSETVKHYIQLARPKHWLKNVFVFVPITFALELTDWSKLFNVIVAFTAFCLVSSTVYVINDIFDAKRDALHPIKCKRPIASGAIKTPSAVLLMLLVLVIGFALAFISDIYVFVFVAAYLCINILYTLWLKHRPIYDCFCIAAGFVLRVFAGGAAYGGGLSDWLFLTVVAMSLFMAFGKRRGELVKTDGSSTRVVLERYNVLFLNGIMFTSAGLAIVFYSLWTLSRGANMIYTVPLIIFIVCNYLLLVCDSDSHGDPTSVIFASKTLLGACGVYALLTVGLLYFGSAI